jgi:hypothetical protein
MSPTVAIAGLAVLVVACGTESGAGGISGAGGDAHAGDGDGDGDTGDGSSNGSMAPATAWLDHSCAAHVSPPPDPRSPLFALVGDSNTGWSDVGIGSTSAFSGLEDRLAIYERQVTSLDANGRPPATTVADTNTLNAAKIFTVRGPNTNPTTDVAVGFASNAYNPGPTAIPGIATTAANDLVLVFAGGYSGSGTNGMTATNAGLSNVTVQQNGIYNISADFQVISLTTGSMATPGPTGSSSAMSVNNVIVVAATVAVEP